MEIGIDYARFFSLWFGTDSPPLEALAFPTLQIRRRDPCPTDMLSQPVLSWKGFGDRLLVASISYGLQSCAANRAGAVWTRDRMNSA